MVGGGMLYLRCGCLPIHMGVSNRVYALLILGALMIIGTYLVISYGRFEPSPFVKGRDDLLAQAYRHQQFIKGTDEIIYGNIFPNCGLKSFCHDESTSIHIYTGKNNKDQPKLCLSGKRILGSTISLFGRGINVAVVDNKTFTVLFARNFDTYSSESHGSYNIEQFVFCCVKPTDIVIFFTFDEASVHLSENVRKILAHLGSAEAQNIQFRSHWYLISQKSMEGFSPLEEISLARGKVWSEPINKTFCVPRKIPGQAIHPDPSSWKNSARMEFCKTNGMKYFQDFCSVNNLDEPLYPLSLGNSKLTDSVVYNTPILVLPSSNVTLLVFTLESLLRQPGIHPKNVLVGHIDYDDIVPQLASLFGYFSAPLSGYEYHESVQSGIEAAIGLYGNFTYLIIIDDGLVLSPGFLKYFAETQNLLEKDESLLGISSWNYNGYSEVSGEPSLIYRTESFPGLGYMIPIQLYKTELVKAFSKCCKNSMLA